jgi:ABC transporter substrate binding protein
LWKIWLTPVTVDLTGKRFALLKEAVPNLSRVALLVDPTDRSQNARSRPNKGHACQSVRERGFLLSYGQDFPDFFRRAAAYTDKILKGAKPADLPVEQPTKFKLVLNLKTQKRSVSLFPNHLCSAPTR